MFTKYWHKIAYSSLGVLLLFPLVYTSWTMYPTHFGKTVLFQIVVSIIVMGTAWYVLQSKKAIHIPHFTFIDILVLLFFVFSVVSAYSGLNFGKSFWGDQSRAQGVFALLHVTAFYALLRLYIIEKKQWMRLLQVVVLVACVSVVIAFVGNRIPGLQNYIVDDARLSGLVSNAIFFANYLMLPVFFSLFLFFQGTHSGKRRYWWIAAMLVCVIGIIASKTRGPLIGLGFGAFVGIVLYVWHVSSMRLRLACVGLCIALTGFVSAGYISTEFRSYMPQQLNYIFSISPADSTARTRFLAWNIAYEGWKDRPILGNGSESFQSVFDAHYNSDFLEFSFGETVWDQPHNYPLEILSSRGIVGFGLYLALLGAIALLLARLIHHTTRGSSEQGSYIALAAGFGAYAVQLFFSFETSYSWHIWFFGLALLSWLYQKNKSIKPYSYMASGVVRGCMVIVILATAVSLMYDYQMLKSSYLIQHARAAMFMNDATTWSARAVRVLEYPSPFMQEQIVILTRDMSALDANAQLSKQTVLPVAMAIEPKFLDAMRIEPSAFLYPFWLGQIYTFMGEYVDESYYEKAIDTLDHARTLSPRRQHVPLLLGKAYFLKGDLDASVAVLRELVEADPEFVEPHWFLGVALVRAGDIEAGLTELEKGKSFGFGWDGNVEYVIDLYAEKQRYDKVIELYLMLIERNPANAQYYARIAATYAAVGDKARALGALQEAVARDPSLRQEAEQFIISNGLNE